MRQLGWIAWSLEGGEIVRRDSRSADWSDVPRTGFLALVEVFRETWSDDAHYTALHYSRDYCVRRRGGKFEMTNTKSRGAKAGVELPDGEWEAFRTAVVHDPRWASVEEWGE